MGESNQVAWPCPECGAQLKLNRDAATRAKSKNVYERLTHTARCPNGHTVSGAPNVSSGLLVKDMLDRKKGR